MHDFADRLEKSGIALVPSILSQGDIVILQHLLESADIDRAERDGNALVAAGPAALRLRAQAALDFVGLGARASETIPSFSYGHQRLIEFARALAANPTVLLLDEPAAGLNSGEKRMLHDLLNDVGRQRRDVRPGLGRMQ